MAKKSNENLRDKKGRVLKIGERQKPDGRYEYRYQDCNGVTRSVYSWRLVDTDVVPKGKKTGASLRELEKGIAQDVFDGMENGIRSRRTLNQYFDEYLNGKKKLKDSTRTNYLYMYDKHIRGDLGTKKITEISERAVKKLYVHLIDECGYTPNSMEVAHTILHPVFTRAVRDKIIRVNPTEGAMAELREDYEWVKPHRNALSEEQQDSFVDFVINSKQYSHWMPLFTIMLGTGCRIGEIIGLRWDDIDFDKEIIDINHQLIYRQEKGGGGCRFRYSTTKTINGARTIPMLSDVKKALLVLKEREEQNGKNTTVVDGYTGFIFQNRFGECLSPHCINRALERITRDFNKAEDERVKGGNEKPNYLPHITCHNFRHSFSTRLFEQSMDMKTVQGLMGHADINTTMDIYTDLMEKKKKADMAAIDGKFRIG